MLKRQLSVKLIAFLAFSGLVTTGLALSIGTARAGDLTVFAASSLKEALDAVNASYAADGHGKVVASYAASSALAKQIQEGAPADLFASADLAWMDKLADGGLIKADSRSNLLGNDLVLVAAKDSSLVLDLKAGVDLAGALGDGRLAVGEVKSVPAGKYAKAALEKLGVWDSVADKLAEGENVRAALTLVARGEAPLGIVYATDAHAETGVKVVATFPEDSHPPIIYPVAIIAASTNPDAAAYLDYLKGDEAKALFEAEGFKVLTQP